MKTFQDLVKQACHEKTKGSFAHETKDIFEVAAKLYAEQLINKTKSDLIAIFESQEVDDCVIRKCSVKSLIEECIVVYP